VGETEEIEPLEPNLLDKSLGVNGFAPGGHQEDQPQDQPGDGADDRFPPLRR